MATFARDVGVTATSAARRPTRLVKQRFDKTRKRITKTKQLASISRKARKLYSGSGFAASTWGHQAAGVSDSHVRALERDALACTGIRPEGRCRTIALMISYGLLGTPKSRIIRETIKAWIDVLKLSSDSLINDINLAWPLARNKLHTSV